MAHIEENTGERTVNAEVNIIPFIDLMSVCIIFLLITAVWTQVSMIQIGASVYGKRNDPQQVEPPPRPQVMFKLQVESQGYRIVLGKNRLLIPKKDDEYDQRALIVELRKIKNQYPQKEDAMIAVADDLTYEDLIVGMDSLLLTGFPEVSIETGRVQ